MLQRVAVCYKNAPLLPGHVCETSTCDRFGVLRHFRHQGESLNSKAATHCNTLQHTATHFRHEGEILKLKAASEVKIKDAEIQLLRLQTQVCLGIHSLLYHRNRQHHSAPHCTTLQHTTPHCSTYAKGQFSYMCVLQEQPIYNQAILTKIVVYITPDCSCTRSRGARPSGGEHTVESFTFS